MLRRGTGVWGCAEVSNDYIYMYASHTGIWGGIMIIDVSDGYRIVSDANQWIVQKRIKRKGAVDWAALGYYSDFSAALRGLSEYRIRKIDSAVPGAILEAIAVIRREAEATCLTYREKCP
jgi:hypothetical protein